MAGLVLTEQQSVYGSGRSRSLVPSAFAHPLLTPTICNWRGKYQFAEGNMSFRYQWHVIFHAATQNLFEPQAQVAIQNLFQPVNVIAVKLQHQRSVLGIHSQ